MVNVDNGGMENNDFKPEIDTDGEIETNADKGQETVGKVTRSSIYGGELAQNEKEPTFNDDKEIIYKDPITEEKVTQPKLQNEDVKFPENLSNWNFRGPTGPLEILAPAGGLLASLTNILALLESF